MSISSLSNVKPFENFMAKLSELTAQELIELDDLVKEKQLEGRHELTKCFEEIFGKGNTNATFNKFDFTRETEPLVHLYYKDPVTSAARIAFLNVVKEMRRHVIRRATSKLVAAPFIVGRRVDDNTVQFGYRPFSHNSAASAIVEADRMVTKHGGQFTVFGSLMKIGKGSLSVEETKQGVKVIKPNPTRVMNDFQEFRLNNPLELTPAQMMVTQEGKFTVRHFIDEEPKDEIFENFEDYIAFIHNWLKAKKASMKTEAQE